MYSYVGGDPINFNDPTGLATCSDLPLFINGVNEGTIGSVLGAGSDLALLAETIYTESAGSTSANGQREMSAIGGTIMNRFQILNGYYYMYTSTGSLIRPSPDWGPPGASISQVLYARNQFAVWGSDGTLAASAQANLDHALNSAISDPACFSLFGAISAADFYIEAQNIHQLYQVNGLVLTSFNSFSNPHSSSTWEQKVGSFGSANVFYGIPEAQVHVLPDGPVPLAPRRTPHRPKPQRGKQPL
jgi:hypothetical protein